MECSEQDCEDEAAVELHVPWGEPRPVCAAHARVQSRKEGVVAQPLSEADESLPDGATD